MSIVEELKELVEQLENDEIEFVDDLDVRILHRAIEKIQRETK